MNRKEKGKWLLERLEDGEKRLKRLHELNVPEILIENEWKSIQQINKELAELQLSSDR